MNTSEIRAKISDYNCARQLSIGLSSLLPTFQTNPFIIICIGTDRSTGDCLGPLVGSLLQDVKLSSFICYGTLESPIHALNLDQSIAMIKQKHPKSQIIAIDACLGQLKNIGSIKISEGPLYPGKAVNKQLQAIGDFHIMGNVNIGGYMESLILQNTRLATVMKMAKQIARAIVLTDRASPSLKHFV